MSSAPDLAARSTSMDSDEPAEQSGKASRKSSRRRIKAKKTGDARPPRRGRRPLIRKISQPTDYQRLPPGIPASEVPSLAGFRRGGRKSAWSLKADFLHAIQQQFGERPETAHVLKNLRLCGRSRRHGKDKDGKLRVVGRRKVSREGKDIGGHVGGLWKCKKRLCPVCGLRLAVRRLLQLQRRAAVVEQDPGLIHVTGALTCRHHLGNNPRAKFDALSDLWNDFGKQPWVGGSKKATAPHPKVLAGYFMAPETTFSYANGFHPHLQFGGSLRPPVELLTRTEKEQWFLVYRDCCRAWFEENAPRFNVTCEWKDDWLQMAQGALAVVIHYICQGEKYHEALAIETTEEEKPGSRLEDLDRLFQEGVFGALKRSRGLSESEMPVGERINLWNSTMGLKWFRVGGIWRDKDTAKSDEEVMAEDETADEDVVEMAPAAWDRLRREIIHILCALLGDVRYSRATVVQAWAIAETMLVQGCDQRAIRDTILCILPKDPLHPPKEHAVA